MRNFSIFSLVLLIDQLTKLWAVEYINTTINRRIIWGRAWVSDIVLWAMYAFTLFVFAYVFRRTKTEKVKKLIILVVAALTSNLIDRVLRGGVVDFIEIGNIVPSFNVADVVITVGVTLLVIFNLYETNTESR